MNRLPLVSIIMSVYNEEKQWLIKAIESIINQTYTNIEFIIVLDNPNNIILKDIIDKYKNLDNRIICIYNEKNIGLTRSLNKALKLATGELIARMDADDISVKDRIEIQVKFLLDNPQVDLVGSNMILINEEDEVISDKEVVMTKFSSISRGLKYVNLFNHPTWMFRSKVLEKVPEYNEVPMAEDYDFICRLVVKGFVCVNIQDNLLCYRLRTSSISRSNELYQKKVALYLAKVYKKGLKKQDMSINIEYVKGLRPSDKEYIRYNKANSLKEKGKGLIRKKRVLSGSALFLASMFISKYRRKDVYNGLIIKILHKA